MTHHSRRAAAAGLTALTLSTALAAPVSAARADTGAGVTRDADARALVTAYDPEDTLRLPGDTHVISLVHYGAQRTRFSLGTTSYACGPHDRSGLPHEIGCDEIEARDLPVRRPRVDVLADDRVRLRAATPAGRFDVTLTGAGLPRDPFVSHEWRHAIGTARETGRTVAADHQHAVLTGTLGGVRLHQAERWLDDSSLQTRTTTVHRGLGPAVPLPTLPAPGTVDGAWTTYGYAHATWITGLPGAGPAGTRDVERGEIQYHVDHDPDAGPGSASMNHQRCGPGERLRTPHNEGDPNLCEILEPRSTGSTNAVADLDIAAGALDLSLDLLGAGPGDPVTPVALSWRSSRPVGMETVDTHQLDVMGGSRTTTRSGIRWLDLRARGTVGGDPVDRVRDLTFTVYRETWNWG